MEEQWEKNYPARILLVILVTILIFIIQMYIFYIPIEITIVITLTAFTFLTVTIFLRDIIFLHQKYEPKFSDRDSTKGKKLLEITERPIGKVSEKMVVAILVSIISVSLVVSYYGEREWRSPTISAIIMASSAIFSLLSSTRCTVYENGIEINRRFIKWEDIKSYRRVGGAVNLIA